VQLDGLIEFIDSIARAAPPPPPVDIIEWKALGRRQQLPDSGRHIRHESRPADSRSDRPQFVVAPQARHSVVIRLLACAKFVDRRKNSIDPPSNEFLI
jgi:hypothetical protein